MRRALLAFVSVAACALPACGAPHRAAGPTLTATVVAAPKPSRPHAPRPAAAPSIDRAWLKAYAATRRFRLGAPQKPTPTPDGRAVLFLRSAPRDPKQALFETDLASGATREILDAATLGADAISAAEKARRERQRIFARGLASFEIGADGRVLTSLSGRVFIFDRATSKAREIATKGPALDPHFSPDAKSVAYVTANDLHVVGTDSGVDVAVTRGGTETKTHGLAEFVAQEELDRSRGFWFSPDGDRLVYEEADTSKVEVLTIPDPSHPERKPYESAYPRAGTPNADVRLGIAPARGGATTWIEWDRAKLPYVATVRWSKGAPLTVYVMDRLQQNAELLAVDPATGKTTTLVREHDAAWVNVDASVPRWTPDGAQFVWSSERGGAWQLELRDAKGALVRALTKPELGYRAVADLDASTAIVEASDEPAESRVYAVPLAGGDARMIGGAPGESVTASFGEGHDVFVVRRASRTAMPRFEARWVSGRAPVEIPSVVEAPALPNVEFATVGDDRTRVAIVRPRAFSADARYPVIDAAYGGPSIAVVTSDASRFFFEQWMADATGAIVVAIDARGTPNRDRAWERAIRDQLLAVPLEGHVAALKALAAQYREIDASRVGVYGWSFGGFFSAGALLARPDVYKVAVAGAPVTDWRDYDTCYTERYLGLPATAQAAYDASSLLKLAAQGAPKRPLLLVHGTADDNVYFMNTLKLADALERAGRPFELLPLAGVTHGLVEPELIDAVWLRAAEHLRAGLAAAK